ncbi:PKD domain-containing protein [Paraglaciecola hydrolytica]|uniref:PKD/Chitinase domain-containing protein n=1 Tax=Paraglaciecola hydrolytica TaxID=1799789 RepID=A0A148KL83_9ALTE|nr:PKD domain-containing protein [Paraglaciecola hydrolytica]KXI27057.1 hypothetical protein AX660_01315 [Paraglaciecola hydrolytica]
MSKLSFLIFTCLFLTSCGGGGSDSSGNSGGSNPPANKIPTVSAGNDQTVDEQTNVTLSGTAADSDGTISSYSWTQTGGTTVTLGNNTTASASFTAPDINADETLTFKLTVTDNGGAKANDSISIIVKRVNELPTVNAGNDQTVDEQTSVTLTGSAADSDGSVASYSWTQTAGTTVTLNNANTATAGFTAPEINSNETLTFQLTVSDNDGASTSDHVDINILTLVANTVNKTIYNNSKVILSVNEVDTTGVEINDSDTSFLWTQTSGETVEIENPNAMITSFTAPNVESNLSFKLKASDNKGNDSEGSVTISVKAKDWISCPEVSKADTVNLKGLWRNTNILVGTWTSFWDDEDGYVESEVNATFCQNGTLLRQVKGEDTISNNARWLIDDFGGLHIFEIDKQPNYDPNLVENRKWADLIYEVSSSILISTCGDSNGDLLNETGGYNDCSQDDVWGNLKQVSAVPLTEKLFDPKYLDGYWLSLNSTKRVIHCKLDQGECIYLNASLNRFGLINMPSTIGLPSFVNLVSEGDMLYGQSRWMKFELDTSEFINWLWPDNTIALTSENSFISYTNNEPGSVLDGLNIVTPGDLASEYVRINEDDSFSIEQIWDNTNKDISVGFNVEVPGTYRFLNTASGNMYLVDITNNIVLNLFETGTTEKSIDLNSGRHILYPDFSQTFTPFVTQTTIAPQSPSNSVGSIVSDKYASAELASCNFGYISQCPVGVQCSLGTICYVPTLKGIWSRDDGRTVECLSDLGPCVYKSLGSDLSKINNMPNILGLPMLTNITLKGGTYYTAEARLINHRTYDFDSFEWGESFIDLMEANKFKTGSGIYTKQE